MTDQSIFTTRVPGIRFWIFGILILILSGVLLFTNPLTARADTPICGTINTNTIWSSSGNDYLITCDVQIASGVTLTIQSGTVVRFDAGTSLLVNGTLIADDCTLTSSSVSPTPGAWGHILFSPSSQDATFDENGNYLGGSAIRNCLVTWGGNSSLADGAIETNLASPYLYHNTVQNSQSSGIYALGRSSSQRVVIRENSLSSNGTVNVTLGGGIYASSGEVITNTLSSNHGNQGGGIYTSAGTVRGNIVFNNVVGYEGGGIYSIGSTISDNVISANSNTGAGRGGGLYVNGGTVSGNTISGNVANWNGGGIYTPGSNISANTISGNTSENDGGGIYAEDGVITDNQLDGSFADRYGGGVFALTGTITGNTISNNGANAGGGVYASHANLIGNTFDTNQAGTDGGGAYLLDGATATANTFTGNTASQGAGIFAQTGVLDDEVTISDNTLQGNDATRGGGIYASASNLAGNTLSGNHASLEGGGLYANGGTIHDNTVTSNTVPSFGHGAGVYLSGAAQFTYNHVVTNTVTGGTAGGVSIDGQPAQLQYNNLHGNLPYEAEMLSSGAVNATLNYWGPVTCTAIGGRIYDGSDAPGRGILAYAPSLYSAVALEQLASPSNLSIVGQDASTVTLTWDGTPAIPDIGCRDPGSSTPDKSYFVFYETGMACSFDGTGLPQGDSPIEVGAGTTFMLTGLSDYSSYHFVVAAHDYLGRVSPYSNGVLKPASSHRIFMPIIIGN